MSARDRAERRLAAILAADIAGYSRLIGADEEGTLNRLRSIRTEVIDPAIASHRGRLVSIVRAILANVPLRVVAANHDTSVVMIERNYSAFITDQSDAIARAALLETVEPEADNVVPMRERAAL